MKSLVNLLKEKWPLQVGTKFYWHTDSYKPEFKNVITKIYAGGVVDKYMWCDFECYEKDRKGHEVRGATHHRMDRVQITVISL